MFFGVLNFGTPSPLMSRLRGSFIFVLNIRSMKRCGFLSKASTANVADECGMFIFDVEAAVLTALGMLLWKKNEKRLVLQGG